MPQLSFNTGNCAPTDCHTNGSPQVNSCIGRSATPPLVEEVDDAGSRSNACNENHQDSPCTLRSHGYHTHRMLSRRSYSGVSSLWRSCAMLRMDREGDFDGLSPRTDTVASAENSIGYLKTGKKSSNASLRPIYTKRSKSGSGGQNHAGGNDTDSADGPNGEIRPPQGYDGANWNGAEKDNGDAGADGNGDGNGGNRNGNNANDNGNGGNLNGDNANDGNGGNQNGNNANDNGNGGNLNGDNASGNGNEPGGNGRGNGNGGNLNGDNANDNGNGGNATGGSGHSPGESGDSAGHTSSGAATSLGSDVDSATVTSTSVGGTSSPTPSEANNSSGNAVKSISAGRGDSNGKSGDLAGATNGNNRLTTLADVGQSTATHVPAFASQGGSNRGDSGESEVWTTFSTVSTFTSTKVTVMTFTRGSSVFTTTMSTTSVGVTTISIPTTVSANTAQHHSNSNVGTIVGPLIGSISVCVLLLVALLWCRRRDRNRKRKVGFLYLTQGPRHRDSEDTDPHISISMSQTTDLHTDYARPGAKSISSPLPSIIHMGPSRSPSTNGPSSGGQSGPPYVPLPLASSKGSQLSSGSPENDSFINSSHSENPFADPPLTQKMIDNLLVQSRLR